MARSLQFHFRQQDYQFTPRMGYGVFCLGFLILFCMLGTWQLHRYHFKRALLMTYQNHIAALPKPFLQVVHLGGNLQFQQIKVAGHYLNDLTLFVQNQLHDGQPGFEVLTPLLMQGEKKLLLIDRGWIAKPHNQALPSVETVKKLQLIEGSIKLLNEYTFILGKNILDPNSLPIVMQKIDINELSRITHQLFYPFIVRLNSSQPHGFVRDWPMNIVPERHLGYAIQWFGLALVMFIGYFCFCCRRINHADES